MLTSNLDHLVLDLAQTENVLGGENGAIVHKLVVNARDVTWTEHEAHRALLDAEMSQIYVHRPRPLTTTTSHKQNRLSVSSRCSHSTVRLQPVYIYKTSLHNTWSVNVHPCNFVRHCPVLQIQSTLCGSIGHSGRSQKVDAPHGVVALNWRKFPTIIINIIFIGC